MERKRALIIDDSTFMQNSLAKILEANNCDVVGFAGTGIEGLRMYKELRPSFVILDLVMPQMDGLQTLNLIKSIDSSAKVIMVSSVSDKRKIVDCVRHGAIHFILKPFDEVVVVNALKKFIFV